MKKSRCHSNRKKPSVIFILFILLATSYNITAQVYRKQIESNHKLYIPEGKGPFPVAIAIPGCSGVSLNGPQTDIGRPGDEGDRLFRRHYPRMAERLKEAGFIVFLIDYLTAEGVSNTCNGEIHPDRVGEYIMATIPYIKTNPMVDTMGIHIIGWSHGGSGVLAWLSDLLEIPTGIQTAIAVYPGCSTSKPWDVSLSTLIVLGEADDIAIPDICSELIQTLSEKTNVKIRAYPESRHGFDLTEGPTVLSVGHGITIGRNPQTGTDAWEEIFSFFPKNLNLNKPN